MPSSDAPSAPPSITGSVVFVELTQEVTSSLTSEELQEFVALAEEAFGVNPGNVEAEVTYDISGTIAIETDGSEIGEEDLVSALQDSIASSLNVHPSDIEITLDPESGIASYTVSSGTAEEASLLLEALQGELVNEEIASILTEFIPESTQVYINFRI